MSKRKRRFAVESNVQKLRENSQTDLTQRANGKQKSFSLKGRVLSVAIIFLISLGVFGAGWKYLDENAKQTMADRKSSTRLNPAEETLLSKINPLVSAATPTPAPQLSKEYVYAGSRLLAVEDANAAAAPPSDLAIWRPSSGVWWVMGGNGSQQTTQQWGQAGDVPVPGDYDGDGKTDFAIFRPDTVNHLGYWYILFSSNNSWTQIQWGVDTDGTNLTQADYDGDGKTDVALWRPSNGGWYILKSSNNSVLSYTFGSSGDKPAPADYDGDGRADTAVWRNSNTTFYSINSSNQISQTISFSTTSSEIVSADYDGDGKADYAIRNGSNWIIRKSSDNQTQVISWQISSDKAVPNDYDGDGKVDIAVWRDSNGNWYIRKSSDTQLRQEQWGMSGDIPVPAFYKR